MTTLHIKDGPLVGQMIEVEGDLTIGREGADLTIADDGDLSRHHAIVRLLADGLEVEDLGSKNGTFVDGRRIDRPTRIGGGTRLEVGSTVLEVEAGSEAPVAPAALDGSRDTAVRAPVAAAVTPSATPAPAAAGPAAPLVPLAAAGGAPVIGVFRPPTRRRGRLATRSLVPVLLSFGTSVLTAVALVIYFAAR